MSEWPAVSLGEIFEIARGGSPRPIQDFITDDPDGVNWIMIGDAPEGEKYITGTKKRIRKTGVRRSRMVHPGDFLLTNSMSFGRPYIMKTSGCIHDGWLVLSKKSGDVYPDYFYYLLGSNQTYAEFTRQAAGATVKNLNIDLVKAVKVRLPPIDEQRRIAAILDKADAIRRKRQQALALADDFLRSAFLEMFGDPVRNPRGWKCPPIETFVSSIDAGWSAKALDRPASFEEIGVLKISAVTSGRYRPNENKALETIERDRTLVIPQKGDLLFSRANTRELVAATCIVDWTVENVFLPDKLWRIRLKPQEATPEYLKFVLSDPTFRAGLCAKATGTSGSMLNISQRKLLETAVPLPPIDRQQAFARLFWRVEATRNRLVQESENDESLFASLSQRAFRGEL